MWFIFFFITSPQDLVHCLTYKRYSILVHELTTKPPIFRGAAVATTVIPTTLIIKYNNNKGFPGGTVVNNASDNAGDTRDTGSIPGSGRSSGIGSGNLL